MNERGQDGPARATFRTLEASTPGDWERIWAADARYDEGHVPRILALMRSLGEAGSGFAVSRLDHCLQTATRAHQAGEADDYVVTALLHDIGELLCPHNHADLAAGLLRPYVSDELHFILKWHTLFQGYHFWHVIGGDRHARDAWRGHPAFAATARFCALYDQVSFDPGFRAMPLETFKPLLERVFARPRADFDSLRPPAWRRAIRRLYGLARKAAPKI